MSYKHPDDKVWKVGMDHQMTCGECHKSQWGSNCTDETCSIGKKNIAESKRWENERR